MSIQFSLYTEIRDIPMTRESWNSLVTSCDSSSPFVCHDWVSLWWKHFGSNYDLFFLTAESNGIIIGFAPLMRDSSLIIRFIGDVNSDYMTIVAPQFESEVVEGFVDLLQEHQDSWAFINLRNIQAEYGLLPKIEAACKKKGWKAWPNYSIQAPTLLIKDFRSEVAELLSKYSVRRPVQRIRNYGDIEFRVFRTRREAERFWHMFFQQHVRRFESLDRDSSFQKTNFRLFIQALYDQDVGREFTHFSALLLDDKPIAFHFGFLWKNRFIWYKPCFDIDYSTFSPGAILIRFLIEHAYKHELDELDFTIGEEAFKSRYSNSSRQVDSVRIYHSVTRYYWDRVQHELRQQLKAIYQAAMRKLGVTVDA